MINERFNFGQTCNPAIYMQEIEQNTSCINSSADCVIFYRHLLLPLAQFSGTGRMFRTQADELYSLIVYIMPCYKPMALQIF